MSLDTTAASVQENVRHALQFGTPLSQLQLQEVLQFVYDVADSADSLRTVWDTQIAILQAKGTSDASAEIDTADTAIEAVVAAVELTVSENTVRDGTAS